MNDEELTRLAIAEIVREMGELPDATPQERKINPIARPNKRFLGRTLNSMLSHNKRENDRTQRNCKEMLKELDHNRERCGRGVTGSRTPSKELSLSSSTEEKEKRFEAERSKSLSKRVSRKRKNDKRARRKTKKSKAKRRESSSSSSSSDSSSSSSSQCSERIRKRKNSKHKKHKKHKDTKPRKSTNKEELVEEVCYEPCTNVDINLHPVMWPLNSYAELQMQQLLQYNALVAGMEASENKDVLEELQLSDVDATETQIDVASISSAVSSLRLEDQSSEASEILQISVSSSSSSSSVPTPNKIIRKKHVKRKDSPKKSESGDSSICHILDLDSDSSKTSNSSEVKNLEEQPDKDDECISIASESSKEADTHDTDSSAGEIENESAGSTSIPNSISYAATSTVMLLTSSESEVEFTNFTEAKQNENDANTTLALLSNMDSPSTCTPENNEPLNLTISHIIPSDMVGTDLSIKASPHHLELELQGEGIAIASEIDTAGEKETFHSEIATAVNLINTETLQNGENEAESFEECKTILTEDVNQKLVQSSVLSCLSTSVALLETNNECDIGEDTTHPTPPNTSTMELLESESVQPREISITEQANKETAISDSENPKQIFSNDLHTSGSLIYSSMFKEVDEQISPLDYRKSEQALDAISGSNPVQSKAASEVTSTKEKIEHLPSMECGESVPSFTVTKSREEQISAIDCKESGSPSAKATTKHVHEQSIGDALEITVTISGEEQISDFDCVQYESPSSITRSKSVGELHISSYSEETKPTQEVATTKSFDEQIPDCECGASGTPLVISTTKSVEDQISD